MVVVTHLARWGEPDIAECAHCGAWVASSRIYAEGAGSWSVGRRWPRDLRTADRNPSGPSGILNREKAGPLCMKGQTRCHDADQVGFRFRRFRLELIGQKTGNRDGRQYPDDRHHDHQFNQRKTRLVVVLTPASVHETPPLLMR